MIIGVDFDNTIVSYDDVMFETARQLGLVDGAVKRNKKDIRDAIRQLPNGEIEWQKLQTLIYGKAMGQAKIFDGVARFFESCHRAKIKTYIVSHKTMYGSMDVDKTNLREATLAWMAANGFFDAAAFGLSKHQVFFESTREAKINRIQILGCTHFIDDLEETFRESSFPKNIKKILYGTRPENSIEGLQVLNNWKEINEYFFKAKK